MGSTGMIGIDVETVYGAGGVIASRSAHGGHHGRGLLHSLESATAVAGGVPDLAAELRNVQSEVLDPAVKLPGLITATGHGVAKTAATARTGDVEGARDLNVHVVAVESAATSLNRSINVDPTP